MSFEAQFEAAADAIVNGDIATLEQLLRESPVLIHARSHREHNATLLHYVAANGVESHRQKTPPNIVEITELLLNAGAEIDANANMYGGGCTTLGLAATSIHPERAGVQALLMQTLLDHGARIDQPSAAGNRHSIVLGCLANGRPKAAAFLAARGAPLDFVEAAGIGRLDLVASAFTQGRPAAEQLNSALQYACGYGHKDVAEFLLGKGADPASHDAHGQTALHYAVMGGQLHALHLLLRHQAPLEVGNTYGGTPLGQALWSAAHADDPAGYVPVLDALAQAGAKLPAHCPSIHPLVDGWLAQHGCRIGPA